MTVSFTLFTFRVRKHKDERNKFEISPEVMDVISEEVKFLATPELDDKFSKLCILLDKSAKLSEDSIRERVLAPIKFSQKLRKKSESAFSAYKDQTAHQDSRDLNGQLS